MKAYKKTSDIIDYAISFHSKMRGFYKLLDQHAKDERVKMYLDYLIAHEKVNDNILMEYKHKLSDEALNCWFKYIPENLPKDCYEKINIDPDISLDDVVSYVEKLNDCLIEMYKSLYEEANEEEVKELFNILWKRIEKEEKNYVRDGGLMKDL